MNTQVRLLNSLFRLVGRANSELVGSMNNTERMISPFNSMYMYKVETLSKMSYPLFISLIRTRCFEH